MRKNFSLVEMLTVIAIISILAGMIMPVLNYSRASGHRAKCINNKSNVVKALLIYADKNNEIIPFMLDGKSYAYVMIGDNYKSIDKATRPANWKYTDIYLQPQLLTCTVSDVDYNDGDESSNSKINNAFGMLNVAEDLTSWKGGWKGNSSSELSIFNHFGRFVTGTENDLNVGYSISRMKNVNTLPLLADSFQKVNENDPKPVPVWNFKLYGDAGTNGEVGMPGMVHGGQTTVAYADGSCRNVGALALAEESGLRYTLNATLDKRIVNGVEE